jgi:hypothetical protein
MSASVDPVDPPGEPEPKLLEGRLWVDGCWDFFHHGELPHLFTAYTYKRPSLRGQPQLMEAHRPCRGYGSSSPAG